MRKILTVIFVLVVTGMPLFAGGTAEKATGKPVEVTFWTSHTPPDTDTMQQMVDLYNKSHPNVQVKMTIVPGSETDIAKLMTAVRGGPVRMSTSWIASPSLSGPRQAC